MLMKIKKYLFLMCVMVFGSFGDALAMEPIPEHTSTKFHGLKITLRSMIEKLPVLFEETVLSLDEQAALNNQLQEISSFIQATLIDPGQEIEALLRSKGVGNALYDIAQTNGHRVTMNWLALSGLVDFHIQFRNDSSYEIIVSDFGRIQDNHFSRHKKNTYKISFPLVSQGYGVGWGKFVTERILSRDEVMRGIVALNLPRSAVVKIAISLTGTVPPYIQEISYQPLRATESKESRQIKSADPLDLFPLMQKHQLTASTCGYLGSYLTATTILSWPDATKVYDPVLGEVVITKMSGRYKEKDIYRYILNLSKDNYTVEDIQKSFDTSIQEMGKKYVPGWGEYMKTHQVGAGPFVWWNMINQPAINKEKVVSIALQLLEKAYRNLMVDKGASIKK
jgi:hypothetical protein